MKFAKMTLSQIEEKIEEIEAEINALDEADLDPEQYNSDSFALNNELDDYNNMIANGNYVDFDPNN